MTTSHHKKLLAAGRPPCAVGQCGKPCRVRAEFCPDHWYFLPTNAREQLARARRDKDSNPAAYAAALQRCKGYYE